MLEDTVATLSNGVITVSANNGVQLLDKWTGILNEGENTRDMGNLLGQLRQALNEPDAHSENIKHLLEQLAEQVSVFSADTGSEGEMPSQLESLATALRNTANQLSTAE